LDVALKDYIALELILVYQGFNPCSLGCCSESPPTRKHWQGFPSFNPCSLGCCSESTYMGLKWPQTCTVSILVLLDVALKGAVIYENRPEFKVSILVLLDVALKACAAGRGGACHPVSILVLLDVALKAIQICIMLTPSDGFQSLFSWMLLWKFAVRDVFNPDVVFQSLFSWMLLWKHLTVWISPSGAGGFNPCSLGCCSERSRLCSRIKS